MVITWSPRAEREFSSIIAYLEEHSPSGAKRIARRIRQRVGQLEIFPAIGPTSRTTGYRQLAVSGTPYIVIYEITAHGISILTIVHAKQAHRS